MEHVDLRTYVPDFEISFNDKVQSDLREFVVSISVNEKMSGEPAQFTIVVADSFDPLLQKFTWLEQFLSPNTSPLFVKDKLINISMGYVGKIKRKMISGKLENVSTSGFSSDITRLNLAGYDKSHKYLTNKSVEKKDQIEFTKEDTYSTIAKKLAEKLEIKYLIDPTNKYKNVTMKGFGTYMEFLKDAAKKTGFSFFITRNKLFFIDPRKERANNINDEDDIIDPSNFIFEWHVNLQDFLPTINLANIVPEVEVRSNTPYSKELVKEIATTDQQNVIDSEKSKKILTGSQIAKLRANTRIEITTVNVHTKQEASDLSKAYLNIINDNLITASCSIVGNPYVKPGQYITIKGVGLQLSGKYLVTEVTNTIDGSGYTTKFNVSKNSIIIG